MAGTTTRFAPSPTGDLHLGSIWTALANWVVARAEGGTMRLRIEDIDPPRVVRGSAQAIERDLRWLGLGWDGPPVVQSERHRLYESALEKLAEQGLTYPCDCSRAEIARAASAPHLGEEGKETLYPGTCRDLPPDREFKRAPAIRLRVPPGTRVHFDDGTAGPNTNLTREDVAEVAGDFVLRRGDDVFAYQLVVAIDDAEMGITEVIRGDDLRASTSRQIHLQRLLGYPPTPRYTHLPLVVSADGSRLAKRSGAPSLRELRERGVGPEEVLGELAHGLGLDAGDRRPRTARAIAEALAPRSQWRKQPWPIPAAWSRDGHFSAK